MYAHKCLCALKKKTNQNNYEFPFPGVQDEGWYSKGVVPG